MAAYNAKRGVLDAAAHRDVEIPPRHRGGAGPCSSLGLQGLYGEIPELKRCEVLRGMEGSDYDAVLISEFADRAALETLQE